METRQKALIVITRPGESHGLDELNIALKRGWRVTHATAMGGAGVGQNDLPELCFAALVIIEREDDLEENQMNQVEENYTELLNDLIEDPSVEVSRQDVITHKRHDTERPFPVA